VLAAGKATGYVVVLAKFPGFFEINPIVLAVARLHCLQEALSYKACR